VNKGRVRAAGVVCVVAAVGVAATGAAWSAASPELRPDRASLVAKFHELEAVSVDVPARQQYTNERGELAWATAYLLEAYLDLFEATGQRSYLERFGVLARAAVERTDAARDVTDYAGRRRVGWSATKYSRAGERIVWMVHSGMVTYPFTRFALLLSGHPALGDLTAFAGVLVSVSEAAVGEFDAEWRYDTRTRTGHYVYAPDEPHRDNVAPDMPVPFNQQLALGRTLIVLGEITGRPLYRERAEALARHFKRHLRVTPGGYEWKYWYGKGLDRTAAEEDISHGAIDVDFAVGAMRAGLVFTRSDLEPFRLALFRQTAERAGMTDAARDAAGRWLALCEIDCRPYHLLWSHFAGKTGRQHPQVLLSVARMAKYAAICDLRRDRAGERRAA
jgi:hypothetical protein